MNASVRSWGTWILAAIFLVWITGAWFASLPHLAMGILAIVGAPLPGFQFLAVLAFFWILPACIAAVGMHLWQNTRFPWLATVPALVALVTYSWRTYGG